MNARLVMALAVLLGIALGLAALGASRPHAAMAQTATAACPAQSDPNTPLTVKAGDAFAIGLPSNRTTGYSWQLNTTPDTGVAQLLTGVYVEPAASRPPAVGVPGRECWVFVAVGPGQTTITLDYLRPFDPPTTPPAQSATFTVAVQ